MLRTYERVVSFLFFDKVLESSQFFLFFWLLSIFVLEKIELLEESRMDFSVVLAGRSVHIEVGSVQPHTRPLLHDQCSGPSHLRKPKHTCSYGSSLNTWMPLDRINVLVNLSQSSSYDKYIHLLLKELYTSETTLAQKIVLTPLNNKFKSKI